MPVTLDDLHALLTRIDRRLALVQAQTSMMEVSMSEQLDTLTREVEETGTVVDSAVVLITGLAEEIRTLKNDPAALEELAAKLDAQQAALSAAVAANTVADEDGGPAA
jgi:small-conductance mechanosensitive channel